MDNHDRERTILEGMHLVQKTVLSLRFHPGRMTFDDLMSFGVEGLIQAVDSFDTDNAGRVTRSRVPGTRKASFRTWAISKIRWRIQEGIRETDYLSRTERNHVNSGKMNQVYLISLLTPIWAAKSDTGRSSTLEETIAEDLPNYLRPEQAAIDADRLRRILKELEYLPPRERRIVLEYHWGGRTEQAIADEMGITDGRVHQMKAAAYKRLRNNPRMIALAMN